MKIISEKFDKENGIYQPTIAFNLPYNLTAYTITLTEDMIKASGICPLIFVREVAKGLNKMHEKGNDNE